MEPVQYKDKEIIVIYSFITIHHIIVLIADDTLNYTAILAKIINIISTHAD